MSFINKISVVILTKDEAPNIGRTLAALKRFPEILVVDSGSSDETAEIVSRFPNAILVSHPFIEHASQWNYGITHQSSTRPWVLALDADYYLSTRFVEEVDLLAPHHEITGYKAGFRYFIGGKPLSGNLYPPAIVLFRRSFGHYIQDGHTQRLVINGDIAVIRSQIDHDDRKSLTRWFQSQQRYAKVEAAHLLLAPRSDLRLTDRIRRTAWLSPLLVFIYTLVFKLCIFDGWRGWFYVLQRTVAEMMIALELLDQSKKLGISK